ncbi:MAG: hypothetical protein R3C52_00900 [Hyphomonadaceae bacterium]
MIQPVSTSRLRAAALAACLLAGLTPGGLVPAMASAEVLKTSGGQTVLPLSGLVIDLPSRPGVTYNISGSFYLNDDPPSFDARDVVDELGADGKLIAGNWVMSGYFTAADCPELLQDDDLEAMWTRKTTLWGVEWDVRGGVFTFANDLGRKPAGMLCRIDETGHGVLLYRFLMDAPENANADTILASIQSSAALEQAARSYLARRSASVQSAHRPEVRNRGETKPARTVSLPNAGFDVAAPDDGFIWLFEKTDDVDTISRLAPTLPDLAIELLAIGGATCADVFGALPPADYPDIKPTNVPENWIAGPTVDVNGQPEALLCTNVPAGAVMAGLFQESEPDVTPFAMMLKAIEAGALAVPTPDAAPQ